MVNGGVRPNSENSSFRFERLPRFFEASSWPSYPRDARCGRVAPARFRTQDPCKPCPLVLARLQKALGPLCQMSLWRTATGLKLANYTHRVALSNRRIVAVNAPQQTVTFTYRDYRHGSQLKELTLSALEFIRRFSLHILPPGLVRIRHYGILGNNRRKRDIQAARAIFKRRGRALELQPRSVADKSIHCPSCGKVGIRLVAFTDAAGVLHMIGTTLMPYDSS